MYSQRLNVALLCSISQACGVKRGYDGVACMTLEQMRLMMTKDLCRPSKNSYQYPSIRAESREEDKSCDSIAADY